MTEHYPRPPILDAIPRNGHALIEASAGTGKTYTIENIVIDLLVRSKVPLEKILVLTFTKRAATELRERIRSQIEHILIEPCRREDCEHKSAAVWWIDDGTRRRLGEALFAFDGASIGTIH